MTKSNEQVDAIMAAIPQDWRTNWCGGEYGACACLGCVQIGNRAVIAQAINGKPYRGDPEHIDEAALRSQAGVYAANKISRSEWEAWIKRQPLSGRSPLQPI